MNRQMNRRAGDSIARAKNVANLLAATPSLKIMFSAFLFKFYHSKSISQNQTNKQFLDGLS